MLLAGVAVGVGTAMFREPLAPLHILSGLEEYMDRNGIPSVSRLTGGVEIYK
jgi:dihydroorotate dehydrogenase (NAD+) catalytic subunit